MSKQKTDTAILEDIQVRFSSVQKPMAEDSNHVTKNKQDDQINSCIKSSDNVRKNTIVSNSSTILSSTNAITSGPSIMEDEDATTTTIAIGNNTYTIGEKTCRIFLSYYHHFQSNSIKLYEITFRFGYLQNKIN